MEFRYTMCVDVEDGTTFFRKSCKRENEIGHAHALTFSCYQKRRFLNKPRTIGWLLDSLDRARRMHAFDIWAYVVMPEHVHLLIHPRENDYSISAILKSIKLPVTRRAVAFVKSHAPELLKYMVDRQPNGSVYFRFWQRGGGYDRNVWTRKYVWEMITYIHANPLRRNLCHTVTDWPWSSARAYEGLESTGLTLDIESLPPNPAASV